MIRRRTQQLTLGEAIQVVAQFSRDNHEITIVVADLINRGLVKLQGPYKRTKVVSYESPA
jgi:hypothetical protein